MVKIYPAFQHWFSHGAVWITSDPHFNDPEIIAGVAGRPSDDEIVQRINAKIGKNDTLIVLGDICDTSYVAKLRPCYKILIKGNHDKGNENYQRRPDENGKDNNLFDEIYEGPVMISKKLILSHEPIPDLTWAMNIHGHIHDKNAKDLGPAYLNVCVDVCDWTPLNLTSYLKTAGFRHITSLHRSTIDKATAKGAKKKNAL